MQSAGSFTKSNMLDYEHRNDLQHPSATGERRRPCYKSSDSGLVAHDSVYWSLNTHSYTPQKPSHFSSSDMSNPMHQYSTLGFSAQTPRIVSGYYQPYGGQDDSTLPSPSLMTPNTNDFLEEESGSRRSSNSGTPSVTTLLSPQSPRDYDFPTGNYLPLQYQAYDDSWLHTDSSHEGLHGSSAIPYLNGGGLVLDTYSGCMAPLEPPYPPTIVDENSEYFDPRILQSATPSPTLPAEEQMMDYSTEVDTSFQSDLHESGLAVMAEDDEMDPNSQYVVDPTLYGSIKEENEDLPRSQAVSSSESQTSQPEQQAQPTPKQPPNRRNIPTRQTNRLTNQCPDCDKPFDTSTKLKKHIRKDHTRPYPCIFDEYGCTAVFGTKNEWFRHIKVQHLRLETWKCDLDDCNRSTPNAAPPTASKGKSEYDRKDLFLNHVRRCHKPAYPSHPDAHPTFEDGTQSSCHVTLRATPPATLCPCCPSKVWKDFDLRCEHIGRAMERDEPLLRGGFHDRLLEAYMLEQGLLRWRAGAGGGWVLTGVDGKKGGRGARSTRVGVEVGGRVRKSARARRGWRVCRGVEETDPEADASGDEEEDMVKEEQEEEGY